MTVRTSSGILSSGRNASLASSSSRDRERGAHFLLPFLASFFLTAFAPGRHMATLTIDDDVRIQVNGSCAPVHPYFVLNGFTFCGPVVLNHRAGNSPRMYDVDW